MDPSSWGSFRGPHALVFGREQDGIPEEAEPLLDEQATVPLLAPGSLNVSSAVAVVLYERFEQMGGFKKRCVWLEIGWFLFEWQRYDPRLWLKVVTRSY